VTIRIKPLGKRPEYFGDGQYDAFEIRHEPYDGDQWPTGPVFPEGHIFRHVDGFEYEVIIPRTVEERRSAVAGDVRYVHQYICRPADKKDA